MTPHEQAAREIAELPLPEYRKGLEHAAQAYVEDWLEWEQDAIAILARHFPAPDPGGFEKWWLRNCHRWSLTDAYGSGGFDGYAAAEAAYAAGAASRAVPAPEPGEGGLLPCPFACGGPATLRSDGGNGWILEHATLTTEPTCLADVAAWYETEAEARAAWNRRAAPAPVSRPDIHEERSGYVMCCCGEPLYPLPMGWDPVETPPAEAGWYVLETKTEWRGLHSRPMWWDSTVRKWRPHPGSGTIWEPTPGSRWSRLPEPPEPAP